MSRLTLAEACSAPLQQGENTRCSSRAVAIVLRGELYYYRRSDCCRDWIEVFTFEGRSLGSFRTVSAFAATLAAGQNCRSLPVTESGRALCRELLPLVGHRLAGIELLEPPDCLMPFTVLKFDDGREIVIQSDPEGNDGGFPNVIDPAASEPSAPHQHSSHD